MRSRTYSVEGIVIRQFPFGESDRIVIILTPTKGKIRVVGKGVRRLKSKLGGQLELLSQITLTASIGRNLDIVTEAQTINGHRVLTQDLNKLSQAIYICELLDAVTVESLEIPDIYRLSVDVLHCLETASTPWLLVRHFEMRLLFELGFSPELNQCVDCGSILEAGDHLFNISYGGIVCPDCRINDRKAKVPVKLNGMKVLRVLQRSEKLDELDGIRISQETRRDVERLLTAHIRYVLERDLRSVEFVQKVSALPETSTSNIE